MTSVPQHPVSLFIKQALSSRAHPSLSLCSETGTLTCSAFSPCALAGLLLRLLLVRHGSQWHLLQEGSTCYHPQESQGRAPTGRAARHRGAPRNANTQDSTHGAPLSRHPGQARDTPHQGSGDQGHTQRRRMGSPKGQAWAGRTPTPSLPTTLPTPSPTFPLWPSGLRSPLPPNPLPHCTPGLLPPFLPLLLCHPLAGRARRAGPWTDRGQGNGPWGTGDNPWSAGTGEGREGWRGQPNGAGPSSDLAPMHPPRLGAPWEIPTKRNLAGQLQTLPGGERCALQLWLHPGVLGW